MASEQAFGYKTSNCGGNKCIYSYCTGWSYTPC